MHRHIGWQTTRRRQFRKVMGVSSLGLLAALLPALCLTLLAPTLFSLLSDPGETRLLQSDSLAAHLEYARGEALRREQTVTICPSRDGRNCRLDGDWHHGWILFTDAEKPPLHRSVGDKLLYKQSGDVDEQPLPADIGALSYLADGSLTLVEFEREE